jgi:acid phosphatase family membrane protein YuiD
MELWQTITGNYVLNVTVVAWISAQVLKTIFNFFATGKLDLERMVGAGGMPSAHSAGTISLAIAVARKMGFASPEFGIAFALAAIVMYDAMGVRRAAGEQAKVLNKMIFDVPNLWFFEKPKDKTEETPEAGENPSEDAPVEHLIEKELKEYLGHTPLEVLGGCLLGILVSLFMPVT